MLLPGNHTKSIIIDATLVPTPSLHNSRSGERSLHEQGMLACPVEAGKAVPGKFGQRSTTGSPATSSNADKTPL